MRHSADTPSQTYMPFSSLRDGAPRSANDFRSAPPVADGLGVRDAVVLVVEDDPDLRGMMDYLLHQEGFTPVTAANGRDALRLLKTGLRVRLILLDLMM